MPSLVLMDGRSKVMTSGSESRYGWSERLISKSAVIVKSKPCDSLEPGDSLVELGRYESNSKNRAVWVYFNDVQSVGLQYIWW